MQIYYYFQKLRNAHTFHAIGKCNKLKKLITQNYNISVFYEYDFNMKWAFVAIELEMQLHF